MKKRNYTKEDVQRLQGSLKIEYTLAKRGATKLRELLATEPFVPTLGAYNGQQAVQHAKAGLKAIYLSGWQVAAAANTSGRVYPDQSLYPVNSVPEVVKEINRVLGFNFKLSYIHQRQSATYWFDDDDVMSDNEDNHMNYVFEIGLSACWSLVGYKLGVLPFVYLGYIILLLITL